VEDPRVKEWRLFTWGQRYQVIEPYWRPQQLTTLGWAIGVWWSAGYPRKATIY
jgi:hypothetical protein